LDADANNSRDASPCDGVWLNARLATMEEGEPYGALHDGAIGVRSGQIVWLGPRKTLPDSVSRLATLHDAGGRWITPGLIDCHTHLVYAGDRAHEFELLLEGASYQDIARGGGGIASTVEATREASEEELLQQSAKRLRALLQEGVTTVEIKSGYGLDLDTELKMLRVGRRLGNDYPVSVRTTFLGAHAVPKEYQGRKQDYVEFVCKEVLPAVVAHRLADAVDVFCDTIGFTAAETAQVFDAARKLGLPVKIHAEQLSDQGGAALAARYGALSADHLEHLSEEGAMALANAGTTAVLLPAAFYFLRDTRVPPIHLLRRLRVPMAVATDCNPGSSPTTSLLLTLNMACTLFRLTPEEALAGATRHAARALGLQHRSGVLREGMDADFVLWDIDKPAELAYRLGHNPCHTVVRHGQTVLQR
jgi:imidazolonepropionase